MIFRGVAHELVDQLADGLLGLPAGAQDQELVMQVLPAKERVRRNQLALYWIWMGEISSTTGYGVRALDEYLRDEFMPRRVDWLDGAVVEVVPRCSDPLLDVQVMSAFMSRVVAWAQENIGIVLKSLKGARPTPQVSTGNAPTHIGISLAEHLRSHDIALATR